MESTPESKFYSNVSSPVTVQHSSSCGGGSSVGGSGFGCIEHTVSKFDTLAGVAIRYGVEVADIKKMNGLTTDLQMFARKSLKIPLPGRHPPSPIMSNGYHTQGQTSPEMIRPPNRRYSDSFNPIKSLKLSSSPQRNISSSINSLRDYYGLKTNDRNGVREGFEMTPTSTLPLGLHRKSKSENNGFSETRGTDNNISVSNEKGAGGIAKSIEKLVRRRKSEVDLNNHTPEMLLKNDNNTTTAAAATSSIVLSAAAGKGLALRQKTANVFPVGSRDSSIVQAFNGVRKSSSAPSFQNSETNNNNNNSNNNNNNNTTGSSSSSLFWPISILNFTADLQALSTTTTPIFDGLPRPMSGRKNKAARD